MTREREKNSNWRGGVHRDKRGYVMVLVAAHHRANHMGYVREHVLLAERALGRPLGREHPVHHVDGQPAANRGGNLVICQDQAYHMLLEQRTRALLACGDADALRCQRCKQYDRQEDISVAGRSVYHRSCAAKYQAAIKAKRVLEAHHGGAL